MAIVSEGGVGRPIDEIVLNHALFERHGVRVLGALVNKVEVDSHPLLPEVLRRGLAQHKIDLLGCIPFSEVLANPSLELIATHLDGSLPAGEAPPGRTVAHVEIGARHPPHAAGRPQSGRCGLGSPPGHQEPRAAGLRHRLAGVARLFRSGDEDLMVLSGGLGRPTARLLLCALACAVICLA